ncbi:MAG: hypothetical protein FWF46_05655 [Oscillospiraceae bacterium]|nr:hypothetical protein [Oscillospiraceae bacterium]
MSENIYCCKKMKEKIEYICEQHQYNMLECPDLIMVYIPKINAYGIPIHDGTEDFIQINYCPWCGKQLKEKIIKKRKYGKMNLLNELINNNISEDEAYDIRDEAMDKFDDGEIDDIQKELGLDDYEWTAHGHALSLGMLAQWRKNGWPRACEYCGREIDYHNWYWTIKDDKLKCLECEI